MFTNRYKDDDAFNKMLLTNYPLEPVKESILTGLLMPFVLASVFHSGFGLGLTASYVISGLVTALWIAGFVVERFKSPRNRG